MRSAPGLLSIFLVQPVSRARASADLPPATPLPLAPGPVIGGTIKGTLPPALSPSGN